MKSVIPETKRPRAKRMRPRAKLPSAATRSTASITAPETTRLLASQRQKYLTKGLSWNRTNLKFSSVGCLTQ